MTAGVTRFVVAIDGPAAAGKGTLARRLAAALDLPHLDTGLLYRAVGRRVLTAGGDPADPRAADDAVRALAPADLARDDLRTPDADAAASAAAHHPKVRAALLAFQRSFGSARGAVLDGRDIGTVVYPEASLKLFVTASPAERARRRWREAGGEEAAVAEKLARRDAADSGRDAAPLAQAQDAVVIDTTGLNPDDVLKWALEEVRKARGRCPLPPAKTPCLEPGVPDP